MAQPADTDDDRRVTGNEVTDRLLRGVVGGDPSVRVGRDLDRVDTVRQRDHGPFTRVEQVREPAVRRQPVERVVLTVHRLTLPTLPTGATGLDRVTHHLVTLRDDSYLRARLDDRAGVLVTQCHRQRLGDVRLPHSLDNVVVGLTPARARYLDDHVRLAGHLRRVDLVDRQSRGHLLRVLVESCCTHEIR